MRENKNNDEMKIVLKVDGGKKPIVLDSSAWEEIRWNLDKDATYFLG